MGDVPKKLAVPLSDLYVAYIFELVRRQTASMHATLVFEVMLSSELEGSRAIVQ